jgi:hypothetical protein
MSKIDLQKFVEEEEVIPNEGQTNEETYEEEGRQEDALLEEHKEPDNDKVPLSVHLQTKKELKELKKRLRESEERDIDNDLKNTREQIIRKYTEKGYDEELANMLADDIVGIKSEVKKSKLNNIDDSTLDEELADLSKDKFFEDAPTFKKDIQARVSEYKKKGIELSVEDAYISLRGKNRLKEIQTDIEQKASLKRREGEEKQVPSSTSAAPKNPYPLDDADKKALEGLQKAQPNGGWTPEKYYKLMKSE